MSDEKKRSVNDILNGMMKSFTSIGKDSIDLAKVGSEKVQEMIKEQQAKKADATDAAAPEAKPEEVVKEAQTEAVVEEAKSEEVVEEVATENANDSEAKS